jgi:Fur family transcriptional regulator, peroxide stress response regulator
MEIWDANMVNKHKYKRSRQRERIYSLLCNTDTHPTANWIYDELKKDFNNLSMGTVYRNINILIDQKKVQRLEAGSSFDRFDGNVETHYHFICEVCGKIDDLPLEVCSELNTLVNAKTDFLVEKHRLDFYGFCSSCKGH